jgi:ubiquitin carboxyl-terminal hydrolase 36/42
MLAAVSPVGDVARDAGAIGGGVSFQPQTKSAVALVNERRIEFVRAKKARAIARIDEATGKPVGCKDADVAAKAKARAAKVLVDSEDVERVLAWRQSRKIGPGLANLGNTCYLNSVLQCLAYTPCFAQYLLEKDVFALFNNGQTPSAASKAVMPSHKNGFNKKFGGNSGGSSAFCAVRVMARLLQSVHGGNGGGHRVLQPKEMVMNIRHVSKSFRIGRQEDSHEFFRLLLDSMQRSCLRKANIKQENHPAAPTTFINRTFAGRLRNTLKCAKCHFVSERFDDFLDLSLEINNGIKSVKGALKHFTAVETLDDSNAWKCTSCRQPNRAEKGMTIETCPNVLVVQLKRFDMMFGKIKKHIEFPVALDISAGMSKDSEDRRRGRCKYELHAVLVHAGFSTDCGHYYAFVKGSSGQWYEMNDDTVRWVSVDTVLQQKAYMLFYSRVLPPSERPKPKQAEAVVQLAESKPVQKADESVGVLVEKKKTEETAGKPAAKPSLLSKTKELDMNGFLASLKTKVDGDPADNTSKATSTAPSEPSVKSKPTAVTVETLRVTVNIARRPSTASSSSQPAPQRRALVPAFGGHIGKLYKFRRGAWKRCSDLAMTRQVETSEVSSKPATPTADVVQSPPAPSASAKTVVVPFDPRQLKNVGVRNAVLFGKEVDKWMGETDAESSETAGSDAPSSSLDRDLAAKHDEVLRSMKQEDWKRRNAGRLDYWDETLDAGKLKKIKKRKEFVANEGKQNAFQSVLMKKKKQRVA